MPPPASANPLTHLARAFGWNLGKIVPSQAEEASLNAAGLTEPVVQRYAVWRRSLLIVTALATGVVFGLSVLDVLDDGFGEYTTFGKVLEVAWLVAAAMLPIASVIGVIRWKRPGVVPLVGAWGVAFLLPFIHALLPVNVVYRIEPVTAAQVEHDLHKFTHKPAANDKEKAKEKEKEKAKAKEDDENGDDEEGTKKPAVPTTPAAVAVAVATDPEAIEKAIAMEEMTVEFVLSGSGYLLLLPAVLSLIPGAVNGCLRIKSLLPAAQLPGWLMVVIAPAFLLLWLVLLAVANHVAHSLLLVFGVLLWAGSPALYSVFGKVFIQSQLSEEDVAKIGRVKKRVGLVALTGIALMVAFALTTKVAGLKVIGFQRADAVSTKLDNLDDDEASLDDVQTALSESKSVVYAFDMSNYRLVLDFLAKLLVVTAVFADLVLRATIAAWRNDRAFRRTGDPTFDTSATALAATLRMDR